MAPLGQPFRSLLIANRGEIACRIATTARRRGLRSIAVYTAIDAQSPHVEAADDAIDLGDDPRAYLDPAALLAAARQTQAEAIHPGYGFLSESAELATACLEADLVWVGPSPATLQLLGDKSAAKALATRLELPCIPGAGPLLAAPHLDVDLLTTAANTLGFPLVIKAAAGGGGRGMRVVAKADDLLAAAQSAAVEAAAAFGRGDLLLERLLPKARHIEVQIFGDSHGNICFLGERDCSVQRRFQKVIEESPAPGLDPQVRQALADAALALGRSANFCGAGTVEFLVTPEAWYFLEVNPRLQVEHPVTEAVTGLDLVEWQLRVAAGEVLPWPISGPERRGCALELRLYAEDPGAGFLPQTGAFHRLVLPEAKAFSPTREGLRLDHALPACGVQGSDYDPLLAKLVAWAEDRPQALAKARAGLAAFFVSGIGHNKGFLADLLQRDPFVAGQATTDWLDREVLPWQRPPLPLWVWGLAAQFHLVAKAHLADKGELWGFRSNGENARHHVELELDGRRRALTLEFLGGDRYRVGGAAEATATAGLAETTAELELVAWQERAVTVEVSRASAGDPTPRRLAVRYAWFDQTLFLDTGTDTFAFTEARAQPRRASESASQSQIVAPMRSRVKELPAKVGSQVAAGETLVVLEAMKLEHRLVAGVAGEVAEVFVQAGVGVEKGQLLIRLAIC